jgi:3-oxoacyl-[acyl-carrier protein] reductase
MNSGGKAVAIKADVSKTEDVKYLFDAAINHFGMVKVINMSRALKYLWL